MLIISFARQRLNLLLRIAQRSINSMLAGLTAGRCLSWCINGLFAYIIVAIIANEIIFLESFRLMLRHRTPNTIVSFICHQCEVPKLFPANLMCIRDIWMGKFYSWFFRQIYLPLIVVSISINVGHISILILNKPSLYHFSDGVLQFFIFCCVSAPRDILASIRELNWEFIIEY